MSTQTVLPLIPREVLFGNPEKVSPQISPDGRYITYIAPDSKNVLQVWLRMMGETQDQMLTADPKRGIRSYFWTYEPDKLIYAQDADGDENYHLYLVDVRSKKTQDITPFPKARAQVVAVEPKIPFQILAGINKTDPRKHDVYRIDLRDGKTTLDTENPGNVIGWTTDADLNVRAALAATPDGGHEIWLRDSSQEAWKTILVIGPDDQGGPVDFSEDGRVLYYVSSVDANAERLMSWDVAAGKASIIAEDSEYDVAGTFVHPLTRKIQAVSFYKDKLTWKILDQSIAADFSALAGIRLGELHVSRGDLKDRLWLASIVVDKGPVHYYLYDRVLKQETFLFSQRKALEGLPLASMKPISLKARDGLTLHGYLTLPLDQGHSIPHPHPLPSRERASRTEGTGAGEGWPVVLLVHGGPWARDQWGYFPVVQWLANRGYAVLQINYRGSTGYGKKFLNAGNREWAGKMHEDLIDSVTWLSMQGVADPRRVAIMGGSYGGYATLVGLTFTPNFFACGIDIVGPSNIISLIQTIPPYWAPMLATFARRLGVLEKDEEFMKSRSPLFFVDKITKPLLIGQGANDPRVKQSESDQIVEAMRKNGKPVEYLIYADEGHGFARPENRMHFYSRVEQFLAKYLGGRAEPAQDLAVTPHKSDNNHNIQMKAKAVMVLGTTSGAGKSWLATALCRWYARQGFKVAPFKAQNMSNNARVVAGGEIGSAQYFQALAAGVTPDVRMNPVLLKPEADTRSQVVMLGKVDRNLSRMPWRRRSGHVWPVIKRSLDELQSSHDIVVIEGAGSPAEINLTSSDIVNMRVARHAHARCLLVTDIDRGGAFAHLYGTWKLLEKSDQKRIRGFVLNKFRGDASLLVPGPEKLKKLTGIPTVAVLPMWREHGLPEEDGIYQENDPPHLWGRIKVGGKTPPSQPSPIKGEGVKTVAIVFYPRISNLDEFQPLRNLPGVHLRWARKAEDVKGADWVILPGSKHTSSDLSWIRAQKLDRAIEAHAAAGKAILGVCGGLQMLGERLIDPHQVEGSGDGLGLLPLSTEFKLSKTVHITEARFGTLSGPWSALSNLAVRGYEIHNGETVASPCLSWQNKKGNILGLYLHGLFENDQVLRALFGKRVTAWDSVFDGMADFIDDHFKPGVLKSLFHD